MASTAPARTLDAVPYDYGEARAIASELGLAEPLAVTLVRRGLRTVDAARDFLAADEATRSVRLRGDGGGLRADPGRGPGRHRDHGARRLRRGRGLRDRDLVSCLRELGARCDWLIPDRRGDGYGLTAGSVEELGRRGTGLVITVDCGIGSVDEVALARAAGIEVIVSDHHEPPERLPDCPILHPLVCGYPFAGLCGTGVAHKLADALRSAAGTGGTRTPISTWSRLRP